MNLLFIKNLFKRKEFLSRKCRFKNALAIAEELASEYPCDLFPLIKLYGKKLQTDYLTTFIESPSEEYIKPRVSKGQWLSSISPSIENLLVEVMGEVHLVKIDGQIEVDLKNDILLPLPWNIERFLKSMVKIGEDRVWGEWSYDSENHHIISCEPIGVSFIHGGNHSIASGVLKGEGKALSKYVFHLDEFYENFYCDGEYYFSRDQRRDRPISKVTNSLLSTENL